MARLTLLGPGQARKRAKDLENQLHGEENWGADLRKRMARSHDQTGMDRRGFERTLISRMSASWPAREDTTSWLSASILHDLRNPLGTVCASSEMLIGIDEASPRVRRLAVNISRAADRMRDLLADLTSAARGNRSVAERCKIREVVKATADSASSALEHQNVQILVEMPGEIEVTMIRSRMERVFFNIITNSLEAMPGGGTIRIAAVKAGNFVLIEVEDNGPGIPRAIRDRLFQPFVTAGKQNGLGLGLALSRNIAIEHGGDLWNEPAAGARFVLCLPLAESPEDLVVRTQTRKTPVAQNRIRRARTKPQ